MQVLLIHDSVRGQGHILRSKVIFLSFKHCPGRNFSSCCIFMVLFRSVHFDKQPCCVHDCLYVKGQGHTQTSEVKTSLFISCKGHCLSSYCCILIILGKNILTDEQACGVQDPRVLSQRPSAHLEVKLISYTLIIEHSFTSHCLYHSIYWQKYMS